MGVLPRISGLAVVKAKRCNSCEEMFERDNSLRNHLRDVHKAVVSRGDIENMIAVECQSLSRQRNVKRLFRVAPDEIAQVSKNGGGQEGNSLGAAIMQYDPGAVVQRREGGLWDDRPSHLHISQHFLPLMIKQNKRKSPDRQ